MGIRTATVALCLLSLSALAAEGDATPSPSPEVTATPVAEAMPTPAPDTTASRWVAPSIAPQNRLVVSDLTVFRYNPVGLETQIRAGYQRRLFASENPLFRDNFVFLGVLPKLNPAFLRIGPAVDVQPLSILHLRAGVEHVRFFGTFGFLQSFASPRADYSDSTLDDRQDPDDDGESSYATDGTHAFFEPTFQIKIGHIVVRNKFSVEYWNLGLRGGDTVFYDATLDTLVPDDGMNITNDADVLYATDWGLTAGLRHSFVRPIYEAEHFQPGENRGFIENRHNRLGVLAAYTFFDRGYTRFNKPTVIVISSWYLSHRWRTGEDVSRAVPYFVLGFAFQSDILDY